MFLITNLLCIFSIVWGRFFQKLRKEKTFYTFFGVKLICTVLLLVYLLHYRAITSIQFLLKT